MSIRGYVIKCDECGCDSHEMNTDNEIVAQQILIDHFGWRVYPAFKELLVKKFNRACKECVRRYAVKIAMQRQREKKVKDGQTRGSS